MRLNSLDVVRGFAIFAMIIAHPVVFLDDREPRILEVLFHFLNDAASPLFALVIGVNAGYQLRDAARWDGRGKSFFAISWVIKAIVLILVGLLLSINFSGVLIVLDFLGIERERTRVEWVSAAEGAKFAKTMNEFAETITKLGENRRLEDLRCKE